MDKPTIWIVDDDRSIRWVLEKTLTNSGYSTRTFENGHTLFEELNHQQPNVLITDIRMPGIDGFELMSQIRQEYPSITVIVMTAYSDLESTVKSFSEGAFDYLPKPFDIEEVEKTVQRALQVNESNNNQSQKPADEAVSIIGQAPAMQEAYRAIARLSNSNATVLITGESGTGKELVANALHRHSPKAKGTFVALNMAALPNELIEAELFGHERGAFTGATTQRLGRFEQANHGTLFLDEIGDMPISAQTRLLRVLAEGSFYRIGGRETIDVDVRIIAATHQGLEELVQRGHFREDLYHRLNVIRIHVPPLRDRTTDIQALASKFLHQAAIAMGVEPKVLTSEAKGYLETLSWPGNVRQLENTCHWLTVMAPGHEIYITDLPPELHESINTPHPASTNWEESLDSWARQNFALGGGNLMEQAQAKFEQIMIRAALQETNGIKLKASQLLGWGRNTLTRKMSEHSMN